MKLTKDKFYKRQTTLSEIGTIGQQKLQDAEIAIVGCGGLGSVAAVYLAASGIGKIHLIDFDVVDVSNLHRQVFYKTADIGKPKAEVLANHIKAITPFVEITTSNQPITKANIFEQLDEFEIVVDCTDSLPTKYLLNDFCVITDTILIYGSLYKHDGYVSSFNIMDGIKRSANLRDAFPKMPENSIPNCSEVGTLNTIVGIIGLMQANEVLKIVTQTGEPLINQLLIYNSLDNSQLKIKLKVDGGCDNVGKRGILKIFKNEDYTDDSCDIQKEELLISFEELKQKISTKNLVIISVIEETNTKLPFEIDQNLPLSKFDVETLKINSKKDYVIICKKGILSYTATQLLHEKYPDLNVFSLKNGIENY